MIVIACWIVIGIFNYGMVFGHFQNSFPSLADEHRTEDMVFGIFCAIIGPIMLLAFLIIKILLRNDNKKLRLKHIKFW